MRLSGDGSCIHDANTRVPCRGFRGEVLVLNVTWGTLAVSAALRVLGYPLLAVSPVGSRGISAWVARVIGLREVCLEELGFIEFTDFSHETPVQLAVDFIGKSHLPDFARRLASNSTSPDFVARVLEVSVIREAQNSFDRLFQTLAVVRALGLHRAIVVTTNQWDRRILRGSGFKISVIRTPSFRGFIKAMGALSSRVTSAVRSMRRSTPVLSPIQMDDESYPHRVMMVLNRGFSYGGLYSYDYLYEHGTQDLDPHSLVHLALQSEYPDATPPILRFPLAGTTTRGIFRAFALLVRNWSFNWRPTKMALYFSMARTCVRGEEIARSLRSRYPNVGVAVLAYDLQTPMDVVIGLEAAGIESVAFNERPHCLFEESYSMAAKFLCVASADMSTVAMGAPHVAVSKSVATGMWRTDILLEKMGRPIGNGTQRDHVLVLPFDLASETGPCTPYLTSVQAVAGFLDDVFDLAEAYPIQHFIIRPKSINWWDDPRIARQVARLAASPNCTVSSDYSRMHLQYELCASARLVIGKPTSLIEESLALGIPCIIHDFTPTSRGYFIGSWKHIPRALWALSRDEWLDRVGDLIQGTPTTDTLSAFHSSTQFFGDLNDGCVQERMRALVRGILEGKPPS